MVGILITNHGTHPPEKWAELSADQIVEISPHAPPGVQVEGNAFRDELVQLLVAAHDGLLKFEQEQLDKHGAARFSEPIDPDESQLVNSTVQAIVTLSERFSHFDGTTFGEHYRRPDRMAYLRRVLANNFATQIDIERSWRQKQGEPTGE
jgi:hypothetical protein